MLTAMSGGGRADTGSGGTLQRCLIPRISMKETPENARRKRGHLRMERGGMGASNAWFSICHSRRTKDEILRFPSAFSGMNVGFSKKHNIVKRCIFIRSPECRYALCEPCRRRVWNRGKQGIGSPGEKCGTFGLKLPHFHTRNAALSDAKCGTFPQPLRKRCETTLFSVRKHLANARRNDAEAPCRGRLFRRKP